MKKIKTVLTTISTLAVLSLMFAQNALADLLPPGDGWDAPNRPEPKTFIDLIEPQHIVIGGAVLAIIIVSFVVLFKMRKK